MEKLKLLKKSKNPEVDFIVGTWMGYIILSVTGFRSSRREVEVQSFHYPYVLLKYWFVARLKTFYLAVRLSTVESCWTFVYSKSSTVWVILLSNE